MFITQRIVNRTFDQVNECALSSRKSVSKLTGRYTHRECAVQRPPAVDGQLRTNPTARTGGKLTALAVFIGRRLRLNRSHIEL